MSIRDVTNQLRRLADELEASVSGKSSDADCHAALKTYLQSHMHGMASLSFYLGCDEKVFQREAIPAGELADDAYYEMEREAEFERSAPRFVYSTINHRQQFGAVVEGASL